jgi:hypothetical protein
LLFDDELILFAAVADFGPDPSDFLGFERARRWG